MLERLTDPFVCLVTLHACRFLQGERAPSLADAGDERGGETKESDWQGRVERGKEPGGGEVD